MHSTCNTEPAKFAHCDVSECFGTRAIFARAHHATPPSQHSTTAQKNNRKDTTHQPLPRTTQCTMCNGESMRALAVLVVVVARRNFSAALNVFSLYILCTYTHIPQSYAVRTASTARIPPSPPEPRCASRFRPSVHLCSSFRTASRQQPAAHVSELTEWFLPLSRARARVCFSYFQFLCGIYKMCVRVRADGMSPCARHVHACNADDERSFTTRTHHHQNTPTTCNNVGRSLRLPPRRGLCTATTTTSTHAPSTTRTGVRACVRARTRKRTTLNV